MDAFAEQQNNRTIRRVTWIGLIANLLLATGKLAAGVWGQSQAVVADAIHSYSDGITDIAVIVGSYYWGKPPDDCHPRIAFRFFDRFMHVHRILIGETIAVIL